MSEAIAALAGVVLTAAFSLIRDWLTGRRDDRAREAEAAAQRVRFERDIIGELIVGLHQWVTSVVNRKYAVALVRQGRGEIDTERFRKYLADAEAFRATLVRARVSVQNPAARPHLAALRGQLVTMSDLMNMVAEGREVPDFELRFEEFQAVAVDANRGLEEAALQWEGVAGPTASTG